MPPPLYCHLHYVATYITLPPTLRCHLHYIVLHNSATYITLPPTLSCNLHCVATSITLPPTYITLPPTLHFNLHYIALDYIVLNYFALCYILHCHAETFIVVVAFNQRTFCKNKILLYLALVCVASQHQRNMLFILPPCQR